MNKYTILAIALTVAMGIGLLSRLPTAPTAPTVNAFPSGYTAPKDLYYTFLKQRGLYVSQTPQEHFAANGYLATDVATNGRELDLYAPSFDYLTLDGEVKDEEISYVVTNLSNHGTMGKTIVLSFWSNDVSYQWWIGHLSESYVQDGREIRTGDIIGKSGGCVGKEIDGEVTTGCHTHIELRTGGNPIPYPNYNHGLHGKMLEAKKKYLASKNDHDKRIESGKSLIENHKYYYQLCPAYPELVSAFHNAESGRCAKDCDVSYVGAKGGLQFMPRTWGVYMVDGDKDGLSDPDNVKDAIATGCNYISSLMENEAKVKPDWDEKGIVWRSAVRYNWGYRGDANRREVPKSVQNYADGVVNEWHRLKN